MYDDHQAQRPRVKIFAAGTHHAAMPEGYAKFMINKIFLIALLSFFSFNFSATAQPAKPYSHRRSSARRPAARHNQRSPAKALKIWDSKTENNFSLDIRDTKGRYQGGEDGGKKFRAGKGQAYLRHRYLRRHRRKGGDNRYPYRVLLGSDPVARGLVDELRKTRRQAHRRSLLVTRPYGEAPGDPEGDPSQAQPGA